MSIQFLTIRIPWVGKTNFWTYAQQLFGLPGTLPANIGLTGKGLTGLLDITGNYFHADGIPVTPFKDTNWIVEKPFQTIHLVARKISTNNIVATMDVVIPVSNEIGCVQSGCHSSEQSIKNSHEPVPGYQPNSPELCARCHGFQELLEARPHEGDLHFDESQAMGMVDWLVLMCLEIFPNLFESLGLPSTTEQLVQTTPYELAIAIFSRWELADELDAQIQFVSPEWKRTLLQFCVQAILYRFNILIKPKYRQLFISV